MAFLEPIVTVCSGFLKLLSASYFLRLGILLLFSEERERALNVIPEYSFRACLQYKSRFTEAPPGLVVLISLDCILNCQV